MARIAAAALGLALAVAAQAPATAAVGSAESSGAAGSAGALVADRPSPKPTIKPSPRRSRPPAPVLRALPVEPPPTGPRPTRRARKRPTGPGSR